MKCYKEIRVAVTVGEDTLDVSASDALCVQSSLPAQSPEIVVISVKSTESMTGLLKRLKGIRNHCDAGLSKDKNSFVAYVVLITVVCSVFHVAD